MCARWKAAAGKAFSQPAGGDIIQYLYIDHIFSYSQYFLIYTAFTLYTSPNLQTAVLFNIFTLIKYWDFLNIEIGGDYNNDLYSQNGNDENLDL